MCRELGWNDTLHSAKHTDPSDSGIRNPDSSQRSVLVRICRELARGFWLASTFPSRIGCQNTDCDNNQLLLRQLVRQFDSVGVLLIALVFFRQNFFQPFACFSAIRLSTDFGLWPIKNSSPQPSHRSVPSLKPVDFSPLQLTAFVLVEGFLNVCPRGLPEIGGGEPCMIQPQALHPQAANVAFSSQTSSLAMSVTFRAF